MENFRFSNSTKIIFGKGTELEVGNEVNSYSRKILLVYGMGSAKRTGVYQRICSSLKNAGIQWEEFGGVQPNPRLGMLKEAIEFGRRKGVEFVLAVGGGSAIDFAKAVAIGVPYSGEVWDFYDRKATPAKALPIGVVLTIPAAGSESSFNSVITNEDGWRKQDVQSELVRPRFAIMNPELTFTLSPYDTMCGVTDILAHVMERYFTNVRSVEFTDRLSEATMKTVIHHAPVVLAEPSNYDSRAEIMWAGTIAHNDLLATGRMGDWASHLIEHELSALYDIAHGAGLAMILPVWMRYVYKQNVARFAQYAERVWNVDYDFEDPERTALAGIERTESFYKEIGAPGKLADVDIGGDRFDEMARRCTASGPIGNLVKLEYEDVRQILELAK